MKTVTDMYLVATLISYGFKPDTIDTSDPDRQRYKFSSEECRAVFVLVDGITPIIKEMTADEIETYYITDKLLYPPKYPYTVKNVKYAIVSNKAAR
jgi:hypothetical protein